MFGLTSCPKHYCRVAGRVNRASSSAVPRLLALDRLSRRTTAGIRHLDRVRLRDPFVGKALAQLHRQPARAWDLQQLAHAVGLSRSTLAERFTEFVGRPPMQYLTNWRMQLAASQLLSGTDSVAVIASRVGYESEAAFSRTFKKLVGAPPSEWRQQRSSSSA